MPQNTLPRRGDAFLRPFSKVINAIYKALVLVFLVLSVALVLIVSSDVILRWFGHGIVWADEMSRMLMIWMAFIAMIDKITPRPAEEVQKKLEQLGVTGIDPLITARGPYIAPFVNAEIPQYLVIEDAFPAGRPPLEKAGVSFTTRDTVNAVERMARTSSNSVLSQVPSAGIWGTSTTQGCFA